MTQSVQLVRSSTTNVVRANLLSEPGLTGDHWLRQFICRGPRIVAAICLAGSVAHAESNLATEMKVCSDVLVPNELSTTHHGNSDEQFRDAMCGDWYNLHKETVDAALGASAMIELIPVGVNGHENKTDDTISRTAYCSRRDHKLSSASYDQFWSRIVSDLSLI